MATSCDTRNPERYLQTEGQKSFDTQANDVPKQNTAMNKTTTFYQWITQVVRIQPAFPFTRASLFIYFKET